MVHIRSATADDAQTWLSMRDALWPKSGRAWHAEGCTTGYLEGWYVTPETRRRGVGRALVAAAEKWASSQGCTEFASDSRLDNDASAAADRALGFEEIVQLRCFRKDPRPRRDTGAGAPPPE